MNTNKFFGFAPNIYLLGLFRGKHKWNKICSSLFCSLIAIAVLLVASVASLADPINSEAVFTANCAGCHPNGGNIIRRGKNLKLKALQRNHVATIDAVEELVTYGKGSMSAFGDRLTPAEVTAVAKYVLEKAEQNWK